MDKIIEHACCCLQQISNYPYQTEKDILFLQDLLTEFPSINLPDEINQFKTWLLDNTDYVGKMSLNKIKDKKINYRARLRRWCSNAARWKNQPRRQRNPRNIPGNRQRCEFEKAPHPGEKKVTEVW